MGEEERGSRQGTGAGGEPAKESAPLSGGGTQPPKDQEDRTILINFVLDKSGSMDVIRAATISGFNEFLADQQREGGNALMTLTLFDTRFHMAAKAVPVREIAPLDFETYVPGGCTALYDAIGHTMRVTDDWVKAHKPDQVLFVIMTDGLENSSREFDHRRIFELIQDRQQSAGYEFVYLGANQDAYAVSQHMGVAPGRAVSYDATPDEANLIMSRLSDNVRSYRRAGHARMSDDAWFTAAFEANGAVDYDEYKKRRHHGGQGGR